MSQLNQDIRYLKGVGEKRASFYHKLGIFTVRDLLYHFPRSYIDLTHPWSIAEAPVGEACVVRGRLIQKGREQRIRAGLSIFRLMVSDDTGAMQITIFNARYTVDALRLGKEYLFHGRVTGSSPQREMSAPAIYPAEGSAAVLPVYPQTAGLSSRVIHNAVRQALSLADPLEDPIPDSVRGQYHLPGIVTALRDVHLPDAPGDAEQARNRFIFEELLTLSLSLSRLREERVVQQIEPMKAVPLNPLLDALPFAPTNAQMRCIREAVSDFCTSRPMNRLVQGDVGSGKTLVVAACVYVAAQNGFQSAVMVPTEILAEQHDATMRAFLEPLGIRCALLTGSMAASRKREILALLEQGEVDLCIGTHALLSEGVQFHSLQFVVTDEQHRFGVAQRVKLARKSESCHVMVLSATPIPRTLALIIYGDLQLSVIDELPPGRQPVETYVIRGSKRARALNFVRQALNQGRQACIVCPLIEQGEEDTGLRPAVEYADSLRQNELKGYQVGLLHGRMKAGEKEIVMRGFKSGEIQVLVSTTVVEVGVDVPNATIMLIENAERFGLSQLHQLRGRVGRGQEQSYCILISEARGEVTRQRLEIMKQTSDGFQVAEQDLKLRGPGDFFGFRQHGLPALKIADLTEDMSLLHATQQCAEELLCSDPLLQSPEHHVLEQAVQRMLLAVGGRPN